MGSKLISKYCLQRLANRFYVSHMFTEPSVRIASREVTASVTGVARLQCELESRTSGPAHYVWLHPLGFSISTSDDWLENIPF